MTSGKTVAESEVVMLHVTMPEECNPDGNLHGGQLLKHIDNAAGVVAQRHCRGRTVTASLDRMDFLTPVRPGEALILKGSLQLVGRTSMEIGVRVEVENMYTGEVRHAGTCYLTYVAIDEAGRPIAAPPLILSGEVERQRYEKALLRREHRLSLGRSEGGS